MKNLKIVKVENYNSFLLRSNSYVILIDDKVILVDPSMPLEYVKEKVAMALQKNKEEVFNSFKQFAVLITHCHADHIACINDYIDYGWKIFLTQKTFEYLGNSRVNLSKMILFKELKVNFEKMNYQILEEGKNLILDQEFEVKFCPGHCKDSAIFVFENYLFCGDLIFEGGSTGRTDFPTGNDEELYNSINYLFNLDQNLIVCSGHGNVFKLFEFKL